MNNFIIPKYYIAILFAILPVFLFSQDDNTKRQLAQEYYRNKEYQKAAPLYADLYNKSNSKVYFNYYIKSLIEIEDFTQAERIIKKQIRNYKNDMTYHVELGYLYKLTGEINKSVKAYEFAIENIPLDHQQIIRLGNAFIGKREFDFAEKLYISSSKKLGDMYSFNFEIANLYYYARNYEKMIDIYLSILIGNESYIQTVQNRLQNSVYNDINNNLSDLLKAKLIEKIQNYPNKIILNELLIWLYVQEKEFNSALIQVKALDNRNNEDGERLMALARLANNSKAYKVATDSYKYVMQKGRSNYYYFEANAELLDILFNQIVVEKKYQKSDILDLESNYISSLNELGLNQNTARMQKNLSFLQAFYLNKTKEAIKELEATIEIRNLSYDVLAECKILLADIYLFENRVWDATMKYAEVELNNKNNPIGSNAKFKKAKLAYYIGDFVWAKAQLDVLKASTSKLIANDAFALSKLIEDNSIFDENDEALQTYAKAELLFYQKQDSLALIKIDSLLKEFTGHPLIDEAYFFKGKIYQSNGNYNTALEYYEKVYNNFSLDFLADDALIKTAEIYQFHNKDKEKAMKYYEEILMNYPESSYVVIARKRFRELRGDDIQ